jgi:small subunit ribosomal protein S16
LAAIWQSISSRRKIRGFQKGKRIPPMVVIRLARGGAKKRPFYNVVVTESRSPRDGRFIERIGFYNPMAPEGHERLRIATERVSYWKAKGAQLSPTVRRLAKSAASSSAPEPSAPPPGEAS